MHPRLQRYPAARHGPEYLSHRFRSRAQLLFQQHFARFVQQAVPTRSIAQIQTDGQLLVEKNSSSLVATAVLIFFIAGLLFILRFEHVDNLGAYSIPPETGLLIPSDSVN